MPTNIMQVSFPLALHDGTQYDVDGSVMVVWREFRGVNPDDSLAALEQVALVSAALNGVQLSDAQLAAFQSTHGHLFMEAIEWIAMSSIDCSVVSTC